MAAASAVAFSPGVISNFFAIHDEPADLDHVGATGGGFTLSRGVRTVATVSPGKRRRISISVNGDPSYPAKTTRKAVELVLAAAGSGGRSVTLDQRVELPIGAGFGSSSASALSAAMAVSSALGVRWSKEAVAAHAHRADIICGTGLGTVSSTYDHTGVGLVTTPGGPGVAVVEKIRAPSGLRVLTVTIPEPLPKREVLASSRVRARLNELGTLALERVVVDPTVERLLEAGHEFSKQLGLGTPGLSRLVEAALRAGAVGAGQNMVGNSIHAVIHEEDARKVSSALGLPHPGWRADLFLIGGARARVVAKRERDLRKLRLISGSRSA